MDWWGKMIFPIRRVCGGLALRLGLRKSGLLKLKRDVRACEYEDVHVMWEMLKRNETEVARSPEPERRKSQGSSNWNFFGWARFAPCIGRSF